METLNNTILIVEDDLGLNELISEKIAKTGYQTHSAFSANEAINWLRTNKPFLIVVDYNLSDMTAKEFIDNLKIQGLDLPPFIVSTGQGNERIAVEMMKLGARDYIIKDTNLLELLPNVIRRVAKEIDNENKLKIAEAALRESEEKFRILFAQNPQPIFIYNINTLDILEANQTAVNFYGYTKEECLKMTITKLHPQEDIDSFTKIMEETKMGINTDGITTHIKKNGEIIIVEIFSASASFWGENARLALVVDITERKMAELAILESEAKMKKVLIESSILIDSSSKDTDYQKITNTIAEISGAKYVSFDVVNNLENKIQTYALSGIKENILKISSMLGYDIVNKKWNHDPIKADMIKNQIVTHFDSLNEITSSQIPLQISKLIEKTFNLGKVVIVKIAKGSETIAFFTLFFSKDKSIQNTDLIELFANQVSLYMERKKAEEALIKKNQDLDYMNKFMVNREVRMSEMKKEVNELLEKLGEEKRYL